MEHKIVAYKKLNTLKNMMPEHGEYYKLKHWVDNFMSIPFGKYKHLPLSINDGLDKCTEFMSNAVQILDDSVYGMNDAKLHFLQLLGKWISNPSAIGTAIGIKGPMGTGKTTIIKDGLSKKNFEI